MVQLSNLVRKMGARDHFKNKASSKGMMNRVIIILLACFFVTGKSVNAQALDPDKTYFGIYANPIGFLTFGPMVGFEVTKGKLIGEFNLRLPKFGALMPAFDEANSMGSSIGVGVGLKYFQPGAKGGLYVGGYVEYFKHEYVHDQGTAKETGTAFAANIGYKFLFQSGLYLRTGGYFGAGVTSEYVNIRGESKPGETAIFGLLDLAIGINF